MCYGRQNKRLLWEKVVYLPCITSKEVKHNSSDEVKVNDNPEKVMGEKNKSKSDKMATASTILDHLRQWAITP